MSLIDSDQDHGDGDYQKYDEDNGLGVDADSDIGGCDEDSAASELMQCKFLLNEYESSLLRIPMIKLYFSQREKRKLPFEARLLPFSCRLPKQMTRGPYLFGEGRVLRRIDEDSSEDLFKFEEEESHDNSSMNNNSNESIPTDSERKETVSASFVDDGWERHVLDTIYEASAIDERIFEFPLTRSQRKVITESTSRLAGIDEVRRIHEMAEERNDQEELDARIWESDDTPLYCRKTKKFRDLE